MVDLLGRILLSLDCGESFGIFGQFDSLLLLVENWNDHLDVLPCDAGRTGHLRTGSSAHLVALLGYGQACDQEVRVDILSPFTLSHTHILYAAARCPVD